MIKTTTVRANPDLDDCLSGAVEEYVAAHPEARGWDLSPRWTDDTRETITLDVPVNVTAAVSVLIEEEYVADEWWDQLRRSEPRLHALLTTSVSSVPVQISRADYERASALPGFRGGPSYAPAALIVVEGVP